MIIISDFFMEALTSGVPNPNEAQSMGGQAARFLGNKIGLYTGGQVKGVRDKEAFEWSRKLNKLKKEHSDELSKFSNKATSQAHELSGSEAAGIAAKKGAQAAGDAVGSAGKKVAELAGEHPGLVAGAAGLGLGALLMRKRKQQIN